MLILGTFLFLFVFCTLLPRTTVSNYDTLTKFPEFSWSSLFDGSYTAQLGAYFSDTVFMRDTLKGEYYAELKTWFGKETVVITEEGEEEIIIGGGINIPSEDPGYSEPEFSWGGDISLPPDSDEPENPESSSEAGNSSVPDVPSEEPSQDTSEEEPPQEIQADSILILGTRAMEIYYGYPNLNKLPRFAQALNTFAANNPNLNVYSMVIPKAAAFYLD